MLVKLTGVNLIKLKSFYFIKLNECIAFIQGEVYLNIHFLMI